MAAAPAVARILAAELGRDSAWVAGQVRAYEELARGWLMPGLRPAAPDSACEAGASPAGYPGHNQGFHS